MVVTIYTIENNLTKKKENKENAKTRKQMG